MSLRQVQVSIFRTERQQFAWTCCSGGQKLAESARASLHFTRSARAWGAPFCVLGRNQMGSRNSGMHRATRPQHIPGAPRSISAASAGSFEHNSSPSTCVRHMPALIFPGGRICVESMHFRTSQCKHNFSCTRLSTYRTSSPDCRDRLS